MLLSGAISTWNEGVPSVLWSSNVIAFEDEVIFLLALLAECERIGRGKDAIVSAAWPTLRTLAHVEIYYNICSSKKENQSRFGWRILPSHNHYKEKSKYTSTISL